MGLATAKAEPQAEPIRLELLGTTDYITDTLTKIRPMFKGRVDKVHVTVSQAVKKGDPLIDLYSKDLAEAKSVYEIERIQWIHDKNLLEPASRWCKSNAISQHALRGDQEQRDEEPQGVRGRPRQALRLRPERRGGREGRPEEAGSQKARMTLRSPTDGFVIERDVVPGNLYDENDTLLVIAPLRPPLGLGQRLRERPRPREARAVVGDPVPVPGAQAPGQGRVHLQPRRPEHPRRADPDLDPQPRGPAQVRHARPRDARDPARARADRHPEDRPDRRRRPLLRLRADEAGKPDKFERRVVGVAQEKDDHVVIDDGLKAGEEVVSVGGLILDQIYEDLMTTQTGATTAIATRGRTTTTGSEPTSLGISTGRAPRGRAKDRHPQPPRP